MESTLRIYNDLVIVHFELCISLYWRPPFQQRSVLLLLQRLEDLQQLLAPSTPPQVPPPEIMLWYHIRHTTEEQMHDLLHNIYHWVETVQCGLVPCLSGSAAVGGKLEVELGLGLSQKGQLVACCRQMNHHFSHLSIELSNWLIYSLVWCILIWIKTFFLLLGCKLTVTAVEQRRQW